MKLNVKNQERISLTKMTDITLMQTIAKITDLETLKSLKDDLEDVYQFRLAQERYQEALDDLNAHQKAWRDSKDWRPHCTEPFEDHMYDHAKEEFKDACRLYEHARDRVYREEGDELVYNK